MTPRRGIKQNSLKLLNNVTRESLDQCGDRGPDFRKLFFALCVFHSTVVERKKFGSIGWNRPYEFSENDFHISLSQLVTCINTHKNIPFELLHYLIGYLNYGGRISVKQDEVVLKAILESFINEKTIGKNFKFSGKSSEH